VTRAAAFCTRCKGPMLTYLLKWNLKAGPDTGVIAIEYPVYKTANTAND